VCMCKIECMCLDKEKEVEDRRIREIEMQRGKEGKTEERSKLPVTGEMCQAGTQAFQEPGDRLAKKPLAVYLLIHGTV